MTEVRRLGPRAVAADSRRGRFAAWEGREVLVGVPRTRTPGGIATETIDAEVSRIRSMAANGIGRAAALAFAKVGATVVVADVSEAGNRDRML